MNKVKTIIVSILFLAIAIFIAKIFSSRNGYDVIKKNSNDKVPKTLTVKNFPYKKIVRTSGRMFSFDRQIIFSEVAGKLSLGSKILKAGNFYREGEVIIKIDDSVFSNQLKAKKSELLNLITLVLPDLKYDFPNELKKWNDYLANVEPNKTLPKFPKITSSREKYFLASKRVLQTYYEIKSMEATLTKYTIKAPFNGYIVSAFIGEGEMVNPGQKIGVFVNSRLFEMEAPVSLTDVQFLKIGLPVKLKEVGTEIEVKGKIARINPSVSPESQSVLVFIQSESKLIRDGSYYEAFIESKQTANVAKIPRIAFDVYEQLTIKEDSSLVKIKPEIIDETISYYFVKGLKKGTEIILPTNFAGKIK